MIVHTCMSGHPETAAFLNMRVFNSLSLSHCTNKCKIIFFKPPTKTSALVQIRGTGISKMYLGTRVFGNRYLFEIEVFLM